MSNIISLPFGTVSMHDNYMVTVMNEGITVSPELNSVLEELAANHFQDKKFVYITHRINSYSVDPNIYFKTSKIPNLVGFAVVLGRKIRLDNLALEKMFLSKPFKSFKSLDKAIEWANELCAKA
ncbi:MAG: hypothetical protein CMP05_01835 [Xanthomarina sp.]|uniref:hypothetical protein n=1 Tax=Xanthomarina sp. TaxID=1931211 RepID=UPI000C691ACC|nr:hypothetical protein [Xanthomarina sp.]MBF60720.1 hypothetical protein [Xanthomarina sp.]HAI16751.1 hypothetical protein [Xanthomarina gelatinilytica]|tara:strand:+ start:2082 stop:2453 length:372 start_codon:yes stop_codon:yes gene_type:complete